MLNIFKNKKEEEFSYFRGGNQNGRKLIFIHGLMGKIGNFDYQFDYFSKIGYDVITPDLKIKDLSLLKCNINGLTNHFRDFIKFLNIENEKLIIAGNSLGGHISLQYSVNYPENVEGIVLTGSSGLYENTLGTSYIKFRDRNYIYEKTKEVLYVESTITEELIDSVENVFLDKNYVIRLIKVSRSALKTNMAEKIKDLSQKVAIIWGDKDIITPIEVAKEFNDIIKNSELFWVKECGHAPMMERPEEFNKLMFDWLKKNNF